LRLDRPIHRRDRRRPRRRKTEPLAAAASREEERREERREEQRKVPRKVQPPAKQTCDRCWQTPETWEESACEYNDRVRVTCRVCGKFIGYRIHEWAKKSKKGK
ncbi:MAG: hypothetical protein R6U98_32775, partial [Pirellulaceae bacterium]